MNHEVPFVSPELGRRPTREEWIQEDRLRIYSLDILIECSQVKARRQHQVGQDRQAVRISQMSQRKKVPAYIVGRQIDSRVERLEVHVHFERENQTQEMKVNQDRPQIAPKLSSSDSTTP